MEYASPRNNNSNINNNLITGCRLSYMQFVKTVIISFAERYEEMG